MNKLKPLSFSIDKRRKLTHLLRANIKDINFYEAKRGTVLGNHFHKKTTEYFYITKGSCRVLIDDVYSIVCKGELFVVKPNEYHAIDCVTDLNFMTFLTEPYDDRDPDIHK